MSAEELTPAEQRIIVAFERTVSAGNILRTTEYATIADRAALPVDIARSKIESLIKRGYLKCATEHWEDYCYILPTSYPINRLPAHLKPCAPFAL